MTPHPWLPLAVVKEARALLPIWLAAALTMVGGAALAELLTVGSVGPGLPALGRGSLVLAFGLGSVVLGAQSVGHEYTHRTLALLLSQPSHRVRLFLTKAAVLAPMQLFLAAIAWAVLVQQGMHRAGEGTAATLVAVVLLSGGILAPWLTMLSRNALAGTIFAIAVPGFLWVLGEVIGSAKYGSPRAEVDSFRLVVLWRGMLVLSATAAIASWRMFMRLEAIEGGSREVRLPWMGGASAVSRTRGVRRAHPIRMLVKKELRLQQMTFAVAGLYLGAWIAVALVQHFSRQPVRFPVEELTILYLGLLSTIAGSLASAEERHLRTLEWQSLLPTSAWKQWAVKAGTAAGLALVLTIALPAVLGLIDPSGDYLRVMTGGKSVARYVGWHAVLVLVITAGGLYASSFSPSGIRAMLLFFPMAIGTVLLAAQISHVAWRSFHRLFFAVIPRGASGQLASVRWLIEPLILVLIGSFVAVLLTFAFVNHRSAERSMRRVALQVTWILTFLMLGNVLVIGLEIFSRPRW